MRWLRSGFSSPSCASSSSRSFCTGAWPTRQNPPPTSNGWSGCTASCWYFRSPPSRVLLEEVTDCFDHQVGRRAQRKRRRSEEHTSELQSLMRISYAVFCLKKKNTQKNINNRRHTNLTNT